MKLWNVAGIDDSLPERVKSWHDRGDSYRVAGSARASAVVAQPAAVIEMN